MRETVLIVGSGAREHAIARALARSPQDPELLCFGSARNPGIEVHCKAYVTGSLTAPDAIASFAAAHGATIGVIGPEAPLAAGVADALWSAGVAVVGPRKTLARIESSKSFTRELLAAHGIEGNPRFRRFEAASSLSDVEEFLRRLPERHVIKDDGLAGGKGVKVFGDHLHSHAESLAFCGELLAQERPFVIEEKLEGEEFSLLSFCDGETLRHMPAAQDHKRAYDGDRGPNTGGMGSYTDADGGLPFLAASDIAAAQMMNQQVAAALLADCRQPYQGVLYGGFMATREGVRLIEYNARFGDPECLNLLTLLQTDLLEICKAITGRSLERTAVEFRAQASVCKYVVPEGYPEQARVGDAVQLPEDIGEDVTLYLSAVDVRDGQLVATGSRTVAIVATGATIGVAEKKCERVAELWSGPFFHRADIGTAGALEHKVAHMRSLRTA